MARLPIPGKDSGTWGDILNDYLSQSHKPDGGLKDNSVTAANIAPNAVTNVALADSAVTATHIADGSITEALLSSGVQTKLNAAAAVPGWDDIVDKPTVIASGTDGAEARAVIGAVGEVDVDARIAQRGGVDAWDDYSTHADGALATGDVTASGAAYLINGTHGATVAVANGGLIAVPSAANVATYVQHSLPEGVRSLTIEVSFTSYTTGGGTAAFGAWSAQIDDSTVTLPPDGPLHVGVSPTGWGFGYFEDGSVINLAVGDWTAPLIADGETRYTMGAWLDPETSRAGMYVLGPEGVLLSREWTDSHLIRSQPLTATLSITVPRRLIHFRSFGASVTAPRTVNRSPTCAESGDYHSVELQCVRCLTAQRTWPPQAPRPTLTSTTCT